MKTFNYLSLGIYQNLAKRWTQEQFIIKCWNFYLLRPLEAHLLHPGRSFRIYPFLNEANGYFEEDQKKFQTNKKNKSGPKVVIIDEKGKESAMYLNEAEKYAKKNKLKLLKVENFGSKKEVYKFDKETNVILKAVKSKSNCKKFILRDTIQNHDLEVKINTMFRFIEKGVAVTCLIENVSAENKLKEILSLIKASKLKDYLILVRDSSKQINLSFQKNPHSAKKNINTEEESA